MWLLYLAGLLLIFGIAGSVVSGGIFTIIVLPLGVIVLIVAGLLALWKRSMKIRSGDDTGPSTSEPAVLPHTNRPQPGTHGPSTPSQLADARRQQQ
jgi:hypothetical protein